MKDSDISDINIQMHGTKRNTHAGTIIICQREAIKNGGI